MVAMLMRDMVMVVMRMADTDTPMADMDTATEIGVGDGVMAAGIADAGG